MRSVFAEFPVFFTRIPGLLHWVCPVLSVYSGLLLLVCSGRWMILSQDCL